MKCLFMKRGSGKTTALVYTSAITDCPILTHSVPGKQRIKEIASQHRLTIPEPIIIFENMGGREFLNGILIDDVERVIKEWARTHYNAEVIACTMSLPKE